MGKLKEHIFLTNEQYAELSANGSITIDGVSLNFDPDSYIYYTPEDDYYDGEATGAFDFYTTSLS